MILQVIREFEFAQMSHGLRPDAHIFFYVGKLDTTIETWIHIPYMILYSGF